MVSLIIRNYYGSCRKENYFGHYRLMILLVGSGDVIKGNGLYSIVFIWDEFTEFFKE
jgi:hypothetical protein